MAVFNNPIVWVQIRLMGGWKNLAMSGPAYIVILATVMAAFVRGFHAPASVTYSGFIVLFFVLQCLSLLIFGTARVATAVRSDVRSGVIESHRLMTMSPATAVFGYLFGAPFQALLLFVLNYCLGAAAVAGAGLPLEAWTISNLVLLTFSIFAWTIVLFFSFRSAFALWGAIICFILIPWAYLPIKGFLPGLVLLASPMIGDTIFDLRTTTGSNWPFGVSLIAQGLIGGIYYVAAMRRYRSPVAVGIGPVLGLLLLAIWVVVLVGGVAMWDDLIYWRRAGLREYDFQVEFITSFTLALLLAILPIASAVRMSQQRRQRFLALAISPMGAVLLTTLVVLVLLETAPSPIRGAQRAAHLRTAVATFAFCISIRYMLGIVYRTKLRPRLTVLGWLLLTWCAPVLAEVVITAMNPDAKEPRLSQVAMCSPVVEVYQTWSRDRLIHTDRFGGLLFQCAMAAAVALFYHTALRARGASEPMDVQIATAVG